MTRDSSDFGKKVKIGKKLIDEYGPTISRLIIKILDENLGRVTYEAIFKGAWDLCPLIEEKDHFIRNGEGK